jgi:DNA-binding PadR family transcriptional regulator
MMSGSNMGDWFGGVGSSSRGSSQNWPMSGLWEAMEQLRGQFEQRVGGGGATRMGKGDVRTAVLALLAEKPMHGYQIIQQIEERSGGSWKPSPGSVYPTLQLLADEGLIKAEEAGGRKTYSLTPEGQEVADAAAEKSAPWAQAVAQVGRSGSPEQVKEAIAVLDDARRKIFSILAQD